MRAMSAEPDTSCRMTDDEGWRRCHTSASFRTDAAADEYVWIASVPKAQWP